MNRRNFIVVTGTTTIGAGMLQNIQNKPSLAVQSELGIKDEINYTIRDENGGFDQLNITLDTFNIEANNIDEDEITIEMDYELNNNGQNNFENISMSQKSDTDIENENYTIIDDFTAFDSPTEEGNTEENNIKIIIKVKHDEVSDVEVSSEFKLNIAKEIIDSIKFVTTSNKIEFPNETDDDVDFEGENNEIATGIIETNTISEMTKID